MMESMDLISLTLSGLMSFLLLLHLLLLLWVPLLQPMVPPSAHVSHFAPETSRAATRQDKRGNIFIKGLKTLISICQSNDVVIR
jgi:hypothetical protein